MVENTCKKGDCKFGQLFNSVEECPHYIVSRWEDENKKLSKLVFDCAPIRNYYMITQLYNRFIGQQKAFEQQRNDISKIQDGFLKILKGLDDHFKLLKSRENGVIEIQSTEEENR